MKPLHFHMQRNNHCTHDRPMRERMSIRLCIKEQQPLNCTHKPQDPTVQPRRRFDPPWIVWFGRHPLVRTFARPTICLSGDVRSGRVGGSFFFYHMLLVTIIVIFVLFYLVVFLVTRWYVAVVACEGLSYTCIVKNRIKVLATIKTTKKRNDKDKK